MTLYTKVQKAPDKKILPLKRENIPDELKVRPQWVVWKAVWRAEGERLDKVPYSAESGHKASSTDLLTWSTFENACEALKDGEYSGLGFVFSSGDPYTGIDLDHCVERETGEIRQWALEIIQYFDSYTELSATVTRLTVTKSRSYAPVSRGPWRSTWRHSRSYDTKTRTRPASSWPRSRETMSCSGL